MNRIEKNIFDHASKRGILWAGSTTLFLFFFTSFRFYLFFLPTILWILIGWFVLVCSCFLLQGLYRIRKVNQKIHHLEEQSHKLFHAEELVEVAEDPHFLISDDWLTWHEGSHYQFWPRNLIERIHDIGQEEKSVKGLLEIEMLDGSTGQKIIYSKAYGSTIDILQQWFLETQESKKCPFCGGENEPLAKVCDWCGSTLIEDDKQDI